MRYRFQTLLLALLFVGAVASCGHRDRVKPPEPLLTEQQMIDVMADVYLIEAMLKQEKMLGEPEAGQVGSYYDQVLGHHGLTRGGLEANMAYYTRQPAVLERIMDSVAQRLDQAGRAQ